MLLPTEQAKINKIKKQGIRLIEHDCVKYTIQNKVIKALIILMKLTSVRVTIEKQVLDILYIILGPTETRVQNSEILQTEFVNFAHC